MSFEPPSHSITEALASGEKKDWQVIVVKANERYRPALMNLADAKIPTHKQRTSGPEDAVQESFKALCELLRGGQYKFSEGDDILYWLLRVDRNKAVDVVRDNMKHEGPSDPGVGGANDGRDPAAALSERAGEAAATLRPEALADMRDLQTRIDELSAQAEVQLLTLPVGDRDKVSRWLDWASFRDIAAACGDRVRDIQVLTFDFKTTAPLDGMAAVLRGSLLEALGPGEEPRRALERVLRFYFHGRGLRLLVDLREEI